MTYASRNIYLGNWQQNKRWGGAKLHNDGYSWEGNWFNDGRSIPCIPTNTN